MVYTQIEVLSSVLNQKIQELSQTLASFRRALEKETLELARTQAQIDEYEAARKALTDYMCEYGVPMDTYEL